MLAVAVVAYFALRGADVLKITGATTLVSDGRLKATNMSSSLMTTLVSDGARVYFSEIVDNQYRLTQVLSRGGEPVLIPTPFRNTLVQDISPDKTELLVLSREVEELEMPLWVMPTSGGAPRRLGDVMAHGAASSPDGKEIVYSNGAALYRMKSDGTQTRALVTAPNLTFWPRWSPAGKRVRFSVYPDRPIDLRCRRKRDRRRRIRTRVANRSPRQYRSSV